MPAVLLLLLPEQKVQPQSVGIINNCSVVLTTPCRWELTAWPGVVADLRQAHCSVLSPATQVHRTTSRVDGQALVFC